MCQDVPDVYLFLEIFYDTNQSKVVAVYVENGKISDLIGKWKQPPDLRKIFELFMFYNAIPVIQRIFRLGMGQRELSNFFVADNVHFF